MRLMSWDLIILQSHPTLSRGQPGMEPQREKIQSWYPDSLLRDCPRRLLLEKPFLPCQSSPASGSLMMSWVWPCLLTPASSPKGDHDLTRGAATALRRQKQQSTAHAPVVQLEESRLTGGIEGCTACRCKQQLLFQLPWSRSPAFLTPNPLKTESTALCAH